MASPLIAANWKMNPPPQGWDEKDSPYRSRDGVDVVIFPTYLDLPACVAASLATGAQYGRAEDAGAFTGDISMKMLTQLGCTYVLCGHSERRKYHNETDEQIATQAKAALTAGLQPIVCIGETEEQREAGKTLNVLQTQLQGISAPIIAYEPVWAIGTGKTATPEQAQEAHAFIRSLLPDARILYGGSVNEKNAAEILQLPDVDGVLVGGASLKPNEFRAIVAAA